MFNKIMAIGNLVRDIELQYLPSGSASGKTAIATSRKYKQNNETQEEVMFIDLQLWGKTAEVANQFLHKGSQVFIEGHLKLEQWQMQDGSKRSKHIVVVETLKMLGKKDEAQSKQQTREKTHNGVQVEYSYQAQTPDMHIDDDELPF